MEWAQHSIAFGQENNYPPSIVVGYEYLTEAVVVIGRWQDAIYFAEKEIEIGTGIGHLDAVNWAMLNLSYAHYGMGNLLAAEKAVQKSLDTAVEMENFRRAIYARARLSIIQTDLGKLELAEQNAKAAVDEITGRDQTMIMARRSLYALAYWYMQQEDWEQAVKLLSQAAGILRKTDNRFYLLRGKMYICCTP